MTTREDILNSLAELLNATGFFPPAVIDEPEPSRWTPVREGSAPGWLAAYHAVAVQDGPPPDALAFVRGGNEDEATEELQLEAAIAYAAQIKPGSTNSAADCRAERRSMRDQAVEYVREMIKANRNLNLGPEVYAEVGPVQRDDEVSFANTLPSATAVIPIRVLYTGTDAAA